MQKVLPKEDFFCKKRVFFLCAVIEYSVETSFQELKRKEVVNLCDGKSLGKVCDVVFTYPEGKVLGIVAPGGKGCRWGKASVFIELKQVNKIGVDVVLVDLKSAPKQGKKKGKWFDGFFSQESASSSERRDFGEYE